MEIKKGFRCGDIQTDNVPLSYTMDQGRGHPLGEIVLLR